MYGVRGRRGLGVIVKPDGSYYVPDYCGQWWALGSSFLKGCQPPTEAEFMADQKASLGPAALANPALVASTEDAWRAAIDMQCRNNPADCADYKTAVQYPTLSAAVGMDTIQAGQAVGGFFSRIGDSVSDALDFDFAKGGLLLLAGGLLVYALAFNAPARRRR